MHIATLGEGAKLYMEINLDRGRGYVSGERNKQNMTNPIIGILPVDSHLHPGVQGELRMWKIPA